MFHKILWFKVNSGHGFLLKSFLRIFILISTFFPWTMVAYLFCFRKNNTNYYLLIKEKWKNLIWTLQIVKILMESTLYHLWEIILKTRFKCNLKNQILLLCICLYVGQIKRDLWCNCGQFTSPKKSPVISFKTII